MRWLLVVLCACGRINFDPGGGGQNNEAGVNGEAGIGGGDASGDAQPIAGDVCTTARPIAIGQVLQNESIASALDDHAVGCATGIDVVYVFTQPATATRQVDVFADFNGSVWVNTSGGGCPPFTGGCQLFSANSQYSGTPTVAAGTRYIIVEKTSGAGTSFVLGLQ